MLVYRLCLTIFAKDLSGEGARLFSGRWNKVGTGCIYTAESRALSVLESIANDTINTIPKKLSILTLDIPEDKLLLLKSEQLPKGWNKTEASEETRNFGNKFLEKAEHLIIRVPSAIIPEEYNYIINPAHPEMKRVKIKDVSDFIFDPRLNK